MWCPLRRALWAFLAAALIGGVSVAQAQISSPMFTQFILGSPVASLPLGPSDWVPVIQAGRTKRVLGTAIGGGSSPAGPSGALQTNAGGGIFGSITPAAGIASFLGSPAGSIPSLWLSNTAVTPGSYLSANITVGPDGRVTAASNGSGGGGGAPGGVTGDLQTNAGGGIFGAIHPSAGIAAFLASASGANLASALTSPLSPAGGGTGVTVQGAGIAAFLQNPTGLVVGSWLASTAATPGTYGDSTHVARLTVDQQGRITGISSVAIAGGGGSLIVTDGVHTVNPTTTLTFGNGLGVSGSGGNATVNISTSDTTKSAGSYLVTFQDMGQALNLSGSGGILTLPAVSSTIFSPGMTLSILVGSSPWSLTNSTGLTITGLNYPTALGPGTSGTFVANADGTHLDFFPGAQTTLLETGTSHVLSAPREYYECTGTCTVTPPPPQTGYEFCIRNATGVTTVITLAAITLSFYEKTNHSAYGTVSTAATSSGAVTDQICIVGKDSTHYDTFSSSAGWTVP
jgi:hypothetical protein